MVSSEQIYLILGCIHCLAVIKAELQLFYAVRLLPNSPHWHCRAGSTHLYSRAHVTPCPLETACDSWVATALSRTTQVVKVAIRTQHVDNSQAIVLRNQILRFGGWDHHHNWREGL